MKLGHYMKIPYVAYPGAPNHSVDANIMNRPRTMFWCQVVATVIAGIVQLGVQSWMFENIPDMCERDQKDHFTCASTQVFYTASVIWGVVGPKLLFSPGEIYSFLRFFFLFGAIAPIIPYLIIKRWPNSQFRYVQ